MGIKTYLIISFAFITIRELSESMTPVCENGPCRAGFYFDPGKDMCLPCDEGSFVSQDFHRCHDCKPCTELDLDNYSHEVVLVKCTTQQDTKIGCEPGYHREDAGFGHPGYCEPDPATPGDLKVADPVHNQDVSVCEEGPCRAGHYHDPGSDLCLPCQDGSFVSQDFHKCQDCKPCTKVDIDPHSHEVVLANCTAKQDTKIGCEPGYHREEAGFGHPDYCEPDPAAPGEVKVADPVLKQDVPDPVKGDKVGTKKSAAVTLTWSPSLLVIVSTFLA